ncbi:hypothetical protein FG386_001543 [Cryptosporidium ryanae]|uniref:uncharacterized protein n=1 Tax=Cryptosporidium ryanae TaxID=515981 RepID=UPI00351AA03D|nr:hypothetical protein FG386_001543 [Cryptosporidium ryanae]
MYVETKDLHLLNGSFFRVNFHEISHEDLKSILKACGLKSSQSSSINQQIMMLEKIRKYLLKGDLTDLNYDTSNISDNNETNNSNKNKTNNKKNKIKNLSMNYRDIINEDTITADVVISSIKSDPTFLESIMINGKTTVSEVLESCSKYLNVPKRIITCQSVNKKIHSILNSLNVPVIND